MQKEKTMSEKVTLYSFADVDRSSRPRWLLAELGIPVEERRLDYMKGDHQAEDYRKINPFCKIPSVEVAGETLFESGAICLYLADRFGQGKLAPSPEAPERAEYLQWLFWASSSLDPAVFKIFRPGMNPSVQELADHRAFLKPALSALDERLRTRLYVLGDRFSAVDVIIGHTLGMADRWKLLEGHQALRDYVARLQSRDGAKQARLFTARLPGQA
jgi:glutathione S-transferase